MNKNHIPRDVRLRNRISRLEARREENHVPSPTKGNPYYCCKVCGIHDPELSNRGGRHFNSCPLQGLEREIAYYKRLLAEVEARELFEAKSIQEFDAEKEL